MNIPANLKYTQDDEWVRIEGEFAFVGITDYAQKGEVVEFNAALEDASAINADPYGNGWIIKIKPENMADINALMDAEAYKAKIGA